jgi:hypothetical protein
MGLVSSDMIFAIELRLLLPQHVAMERSVCSFRDTCSNSLNGWVHGKGLLQLAADRRGHADRNVISWSVYGAVG